MAAPYIPAPDAGFNDWLVNFATLIAASPTTYGLVSGDATSITSVKSTWATSYALAINPTTRTSATVAAKDVARSSAEATCRPYAIRVRDNAAVSDALKVGLGLTIPNTPPSPIPPPSIAPTLSLIAATPLVLKVTYKDPESVSKAKPFGAIGTEIWQSIGTVPATDPAQCDFVGIVTKTPFFLDYVDANRGKIATLFARFSTRSGPTGRAQAGPWSTSLVTHIV